MSSNLQPQIPSQTGEPAWEAATLFPMQGHWQEADFLRLHTNRMAELANGHLDVLPIPTWIHQMIVKWIVNLIEQHLQANEINGVVMFAPLPVRLFPGTIREPDVLYVAAENMPTADEEYPTSVTLVVEVVSKGREARRRDYEHKRIEYATAGIAEYWIVDPEEQQVTILSLTDQAYETLGVYRTGEVATSGYFAGLSFEVAPLMAIGKL